MTNITTTGNDYLAAPQRYRKDHIPSVGDIYYRKDSYYPDIYRITGTEKREGRYTVYRFEKYNLSTDRWETSERNTISPDSLEEYYRLLIGDFDEVLAVARAAVQGDDSALNKLLSEADNSPETLALVQTGTAQQVLSLTEKGEMLQDKIETIKNYMQMLIASARHEMEAKVSALDKKLLAVKDYVKNLQRVITVMNLYTGSNVDIVIVRDGAPAPDGEPIRIRQRILFMDEEYLASAENGGIDYNDIGEFNKWLSEPANLDVVLPEPRCIVAMKPKRYDASYSRDWYINKLLNQWNHHTYVFFRDGERILMIDSDDLELHGTAIPYSDQAERFAREYEKLTASPSTSESEIRTLHERSEQLGYMYTKYISFLQGVIDSGRIFDMSKGRPNLAKGDGVEYIYDDENAIGTGTNWRQWQEELNSHIRRGTRILFHPKGNNGDSCGKPNRYYSYESSEPYAPEAGVYNVDYPTKTEYRKNPDTGRYERVTAKRDRLAIFYNPKRWRWGDEGKDRNEAWLYNPKCCINYDLLTVEAIDAMMADRTQRESFREWMPILQKARKALVEEKENEALFKQIVANEYKKKHHCDDEDKLNKVIDEAVDWWKGKVIFTRSLSTDDAKAWRMICSETERRMKDKKKEEE